MFGGCSLIFLGQQPFQQLLILFVASLLGTLQNLQQNTTITMSKGMK